MLSTTPQAAPRGTQRRTLGGAIVAIVVVGVILRVIQYAANTSLWLDEIALVKGILGADLFDLVARPLPFDQVAPKGFLVAQKLVVEALGPSDYALRLIPFLASVVGLVGFAQFAKSALTPVGAVAATAMLPSAAPLVAFAGIVKQYSTDVCVAVFLVLLTFELVTRPVTNRVAWRAAIAGAALVWFSQPAVLLVTALACLLML